MDTQLIITKKLSTHDNYQLNHKGPGIKKL